MLNNQNIIKRTLLALVTILFCYFVLKVFLQSPLPNSISYVNNNFNVLGLSIPSNLDFCGEKIPSNDYEIKEELEKEFFNNSYWKNNSIILFNKARRWFPYIEPILKAQGVPDDFKYLAVIESHLSNVLSPAGAAGFWQLLPVTAAHYGLEVNAGIDERYDVEKATVAACKILKQAHQVFKNWTLAAAAYNRGIGGILKAMKDQKESTYYDLLLNSETGAFVYRILAYKTLFSSPEHFGIKKKSWNYYPKVRYNIYTVDSSITHMQAFAAHIGSSISTIKLFNPWLLKNNLPNPAKKIYQIHIPKVPSDYSGYTNDMMTEFGRSSIGTVTVSGNSGSIPDSLKLTAITTVTHIVKIDESMADLAKFLRVNETDLRKWNNLNNTENAVKGQTLIVHYPKSANKK